MTPYEKLGVRSDASPDEIKKAYLEGNYPIADLVEVEALRFLLSLIHI